MLMSTCSTRYYSKVCNTLATVSISGFASPKCEIYTPEEVAISCSNSTGPILAY